MAAIVVGFVAVFGLVLFALIVMLNILARRETKRRAKLTPGERAMLEHEDAVFSQSW